MGALIEGHQHHRFEVVITEFAIGSAQLLKQELHHLAAGIAGGEVVHHAEMLACDHASGVMKPEQWFEAWSEA
jgi:hypothetical protein